MPSAHFKPWSHAVGLRGKAVSHHQLSITLEPRRNPPVARATLAGHLSKEGQRDMAEQMPLTS